MATEIIVIERDELFTSLLKAVRSIVKDEVTKAIRSNRPESYSRKEAADLLGITPTTLNKKILTQCIRSTTDGTRISTAEIDRYLNDK